MSYLGDLRGSRNEDSIEIGLSDLAMDLLVRAIAVVSPAYTTRELRA
jgi:hypothetical protein